MTRDGDAPAADTATEAGGGQDTNGASGATSSAATPTGDAPPDKRSDADRTDGDGGSKATRPWRSAKKQAREALARYATAKRQVEELEALGPQRVLGDDFDAAAAGVSSAVDAMTRAKSHGISSNTKNVSLNVDLLAGTSMSRSCTRFSWPRSSRLNLISRRMRVAMGYVSSTDRMRIC